LPISAKMVAGSTKPTKYGQCAIYLNDSTK
jgi:hypothetical protein